MAKDGAPGLFGKVVRLVLPGAAPRSSIGGAGSVAEADSELEQDAGKGRKLLRELMERRRRNDLVRQREFDQLRRMRRMVAASNPSSRDTGADSDSAMSGFQDTAYDHNLEERAVTLKKINEIEEQMSRQWWKTRPAEPADTIGGSAAAGAQARRKVDVPASRHDPLASEGSFDFGPQPRRPASRFLPTISQASETAAARAAWALSGMTPDFELPDMAAPATQPPDLELPDAALSRLVGTGPGPFPGPQPALPGFIHHPLVEEAAIAFANGEIVAARDGLRMLIEAAGTQPCDEEGTHELWFTLLDLYRALGHRDQFETTAIAYAERFDRSPPAWISLAVETSRLPASLGVGVGDLRWGSPALVSAHTVLKLRENTAAAAGAWWLDWSGLEGFEYDAVAPLLETFGAWCRQPVQIFFEGADRLLSALEARTLTGAADAEADWWRLRMEALRLMRRMDDYEEAALDYCITYEVSPPAWIAPVCDCRNVQAGGFLAPCGESPDAMDLPVAPAAEGAQLVGEIGSDVGDVLAQLDAILSPQGRFAQLPGQGELLVVDCSRLVRLDFVAAGSVLGWAASRHGEGLAVEFRGLNRLAGAFFNVTGINEYARVYVRAD